LILVQTLIHDDVSAAKFLLNNGADVALCDADGISALFNASNPNSSMSEQVDPAMIRLLFDFGADPDTRFDGISALFNASNPNSSMSEQVDPAMIRLLFDFGADPDTRFDGKSCGAMCAGYDGCSAMFKAARIYYADCKFLAMKTAGLRDPDARRVLTARIHCIETTQGAELEEYEEYNRKRRDYGACWSDEDGEESGDESGDEEE
jgi:ankyrin repeat protein